jgi:putative endonuclease
LRIPIIDGSAVYAAARSFARACIGPGLRLKDRITRGKEIICGNREQEGAGYSAHIALGALGEKLALAHLKRCGYRIAATNFTAPIGHGRDGRTISGEIDIIAWDETTDPPTLAFVEVKTRSGDAFAAPAAAVNRRKQRRIIRAARFYRRLLHLYGEEPDDGAEEYYKPRQDQARGEKGNRISYRYDVVGIVAAPGREVRIELHRGFFDESAFAQSRWAGRREQDGFPERYGKRRLPQPVRRREMRAHD